MNIAIINDQHFGVNGASEFFMGEYETFYAETFFPSIDSVKPDAVVIPGDIWENRKYISPLTLAQAIRQFFAPLAARNLPVIIGYGNHDTYYKDTNTINSVDFLAEMFKNVRVVKTAEKISNFVLASWICPDNADDVMSFIASTDAKYLLGHFEINGHAMTPGYLCTHGLDAATFKKFERVISGHFHVRGNDGRIYYTSNPSQTSWADWGQEKGFHYFDDVANKLTAVNNPRDIYTVINWQEDSTYDEYHEFVAGKIVKIRISSLNSIDREKFGQFAAACIETSYRTTVVEIAATEGKADDQTIQTLGDASFTSIEQTIKDYVDETVPDDSKDLCKALILDIKARAEVSDA